MLSEAWSLNTLPQLVATAGHEREPNLSGESEYCKQETETISHMKQMSSFVHHNLLKCSDFSFGIAHALRETGGSRKLHSTVVYCRALPHGDSPCPPPHESPCFLLCGSRQAFRYAPTESACTSGRSGTRWGILDGRCGTESTRHGSSKSLTTGSLPSRCVPLVVADTQAPSNCSNPGRLRISLTDT
jgi:hypothetical protein